MNDNKLGDAPIEDRYYDTMNELAAGLDEILNGRLRGSQRKTGFVLLVFPFHSADGRANYISNGQRSQIIKLLEDQLARFKKQDAERKNKP